MLKKNPFQSITPAESTAESTQIQSEVILQSEAIHSAQSTPSVQKTTMVPLNTGRFPHVENLINKINWEKISGLLPAIVQDVNTKQVLMLGYMTREALTQSLTSGCVTFYSRTRQCLWKKGERSGHCLRCLSIQADCDWDSVLVWAIPEGPTCHTGAVSCFHVENTVEHQNHHHEKTCHQPDSGSELRNVFHRIQQRMLTRPEGSYTVELVDAGVPRVAQKVGEEAVEVVIAALGEELSALCEESADLLYHLCVLLAAKKVDLQAVFEVLYQRARA